MWHRVLSLLLLRIVRPLVTMQQLRRHSIAQNAVVQVRKRPPVHPVIILLGCQEAIVEARQARIQVVGEPGVRHDVPCCTPLQRIRPEDVVEEVLHWYRQHGNGPVLASEDSREHFAHEVNIVVVDACTVFTLIRPAEREPSSQQHVQTDSAAPYVGILPVVLRLE